MREFELVNITKGATGDEERIVFRVLVECNLSNYILIDKTYDENGQVSNVHRHCYVFPNIEVQRGDFIILYTGKGTPRSYTNNSQTTSHMFYWGFDEGVSIWNTPTDWAFILKYSEFQSFAL